MGFYWQAYVNKIDFDYMEYAKQRFEQYRLRKQQLLGSSAAKPPAEEVSL